MIFTIASLVMRFVAGKASDNYGRKPVLKLSLIVLCIALVWIGTAQTITGFIIGAILYGVATGMLSPAISAWTVDLSDADKRGLSVATMYIALEAGIGLGAFFAGWFFQDTIERIPYLFYGAALANAFAVIYLFLHKNKPKPLVFGA
jgi:MFS family permease